MITARSAKHKKQVIKTTHLGNGMFPGVFLAVIWLEE
jgi:hypothetical protein